MSLKIFEMFSGYGGASFALKLAKIPYECVGYSEIDKNAIHCYNNNFKGVKNYGDCKNINPFEIPDFDLLTAGFPCQPFSEAGKNGGINDTRGTLFYDIIRIAESKKPKFLVLENVKGLTFSTHKKTFDIILKELYRVGYDVKYKVINSRDYGTPQNRERIIFLCSLKSLNYDIKFPEKVTLNKFIKDIVIKDNNDLSLNFEKKWKSGFIKDQFPEKINGVNYSNEFISVAVKNKNRAKHQHSNLPYGSFPIEYCIRFNRDYGVSFAVKSAKHEFMISDFDLNNIRYLSSIECFRLMGFFNDEINLEGLSETSKMKLVGNGWDINLFSQVFSEFLIGK